MIPLIQKEIEVHAWLNIGEFADIVAISQMTPGPIAVNAATYVGMRTAGFWGSFFATLGVSLPSFILIFVVAHFFIKFKENRVVNSVLQGIRPATIGLIASAVILFAEMSFLRNEIPFEKIGTVFTGKAIAFFQSVGINPGAFIIFVVILVASKKFKLHPIAAVFVSAVLGMVLT